MSPVVQENGGIGVEDREYHSSLSWSGLWKIADSSSFFVQPRLGNYSGYENAIYDERLMTGSAVELDSQVIATAFGVQSKSEPSTGNHSSYSRASHPLGPAQCQTASPT